MNKNPFIFLLSLLAITSIFPQDIQLKSLKYYPGENESAFPVISYGRNGTGYISIDFDIAALHQPDLNIVFRFCDRNWNPYENAFLINFGQNIAPNISLRNLPTIVQQAMYHFHGKFPDSNRYVSFPFSGNWMFFITDAQDTSKVYGYGKFYVVREEIAIHDTLKNEVLEGNDYFPTDLGKVFNITTSFTLDDKLFPGFVNCVYIIENHKIDYPVIIDRKFNTNVHQFYSDGNRGFRFIASDIHPGNEYRQVDLRDVNRYNSVNVRAQFDGLEYSRFFKEGSRDLNGGSVINGYKEPNSTYLNVNFSIRPPDKVYGNVFLVGAFNNWELSTAYMMDYSGGVFTKTIELKRGIYDYQYVVAELNNGRIENPDWYILEGNSYYTTNEYHVFVYYTDQNYGGYDKIIGYNKIVSK